ncbi:hypothetical protein F0562_029468 [Nyssa sinensis]|uniref:DUF4005 domain-containing protein n=1 Tax=Nyssa sinensis TaxID=561372 RepID=A0A5J5B352_9ASTE|nr:hypothetical protein F0562_029468 [Nyssa sinensis]
MGKASKWIRNILLGKKEEKDKKTESSFLAQSLATPRAILPETPKEKRRWSFGRSASTDNARKSNRSFDSIVTTQLVTKALLEHEQAQPCATAMALATNEATKRAMRVRATAAHAPAGKPGPVKDAAATKIQAAFRSYLARKALCALRGLVKLQALVRGHLVRKQTNALMRCMHALMAIQVRARVQRIQMAEEAQHSIKRQTNHKELAQDYQLSKAFSETIDVNINEIPRGLKSKSGRINNPQIKRMEHGFSTYYSGSLSISNQEHHVRPNPSALTDRNSRNCNKQFDEYCFTTAKRSSQYYSTMSKNNPTITPFVIPLPDYGDSLSHDNQFFPNFMANTESSRAKVRSQSEPKQRPKQSMKQKSRRSTSMEGMDDTQDIQMQCSSSNARHNTQKNQYPWLIKLYRSTKSIKDSEQDSTSTTTNNSNNCSSLIGYEPLVNLY